MAFRRDGIDRAKVVPSATTGISLAFNGPVRIELPLTGRIRTGGPALEQALEAVPGVRRATVKATGGRAYVEYDPREVAIGQLVQAVRAAGFETGSAHLRLRVQGLSCPEGVARIEDALNATPGVLDASLNAATDEVRVTYLPGVVDLQALLRAVEGAGPYRANPTAAGQFARGEETAEQDRMYRDLLRRWWLGVAAGLPLILLASTGPVLGDIVPPTDTAFRLVWPAAAFASLAVMVFSGSPLFASAWQGLRHRAVTRHTLIVLAAALAWLYPTTVLLFPQAFPARDDSTVVFLYGVAVMIVAIAALGLALEVQAKQRIADDVRRRARLQAATARVVRAGRVVRLPAEELLVGDVVVVEPVESVPVDGVVIEGASAVDERAITGESAPIAKQAGDEVLAATRNVTARLTVQATRVGKETALASVIRLAQDAQSSKVPIQRVAEAVAAALTPTVLILAIGGFVAWYAFGPSPALTAALTVLVTTLIVSNPSAVGLALPASLTAGLERALQQGILIRSGEVMQTAACLRTVVLIKTGTLTQGRPVLAAVVVPGSREGGAPFDEDEVLRLAAAAEYCVSHPLATAIVAGARARGLVLPEATRVRVVPGEGVEADVAGRHVLVGNARLMAAHGIQPMRLEVEARWLADDGKTPLYVAVDGAAAGIVATADPVRDEASAAVAALRHMGLEVVLLTGDDRRTALALASQVGIEQVLAEVAPQARASRIRTLQLAGARVGVVGDGTRDAPALDRADVGFAVAAGADVALVAGDVTLLNDNLMGVVTAIELSRAALRNGWENLSGALLTNALGLLLALGLVYPLTGWSLAPVLAALVGSFSPVLVLHNANRLHRWPFSRRRSGRTSSAAGNEVQDSYSG